MEWFIVFVIAFLAAPVSWALGWILDFQHSPQGERLSNNLAWVFLKNAFGFAFTLILILIAYQAFIALEIT